MGNWAEPDEADAAEWERAGLPGGLQSGGWSVTGDLHDNEDRWVAMDDVGAAVGDDAAPTAYYAVFDGHSGESGEAGQEAAEHAAAKLHYDILRAGYGTLAEDMREGMVQCNKTFSAGAQERGSDSGACALVAMLRGRHLAVANAGDCRCLLVEAGQERVVPMSRDHNACEEQERARIQRSVCLFVCFLCVHNAKHTECILAVWVGSWRKGEYLDVLSLRGE